MRDIAPNNIARLWGFNICHRDFFNIKPARIDPRKPLYIGADFNVGMMASAFFQDYVNPEQDVKADLAEISGGLSTISEKLRRRGYKPELVFAELKSDYDRLRKDGTLDLLLQLQTGQAPMAPAPAAASPGTV